MYIFTSPYCGYDLTSCTFVSSSLAKMYGSKPLTCEKQWKINYSLISVNANKAFNTVNVFTVVFSIDILKFIFIKMISKSIIYAMGNNEICHMFF